MYYIPFGFIVIAVTHLFVQPRFVRYFLQAALVLEFLQPEHCLPALWERLCLIDLLLALFIVCQSTTLPKVAPNPVKNQIIAPTNTRLIITMIVLFLICLKSADNLFQL